MLVYALWVAVFALVFATDWLSWQQTNRTVRATIPLDGAAGARIQLRHSAGRLRLDAADDAAAMVEGVFGGGLDQNVSIVGGQADVRLAVTRLSGFLSPRYPWAWGRATSLDWDVGVSGRIPIALTVEAVDDTGLLELGGLRLTELDIRVTAASLEVSLPAHDSAVRVRVDAKAGSVDLRGAAVSVAGVRDGRGARRDRHTRVRGLDHRLLRASPRTLAWSTIRGGRSSWSTTIALLFG